MLTLFVFSTKQITIEFDQNTTSNAFDFNNCSFRQYDNRKNNQIYHVIEQQNNQLENIDAFFDEIWEFCTTYSNDENHEIYYKDDEYLNDDFIEKKLENQNDFEITKTNFVNQSINQCEITKIKNIFIEIFLQKSIFVCRRCNISFYFNNKLYKYIRQYRVEIVKTFNFEKNDVVIIEFDAIKKQNTRYNFRL